MTLELTQAPTLERNAALPLEIWEHIASFIPFSEFRIRKLYTINRCFLYHYLAKHYQDFYFLYAYVYHTQSDIALMKRVAFMRSAPRILSRVQRFEMRFREYDPTRAALRSKWTAKDWCASKAGDLLAQLATTVGLSAYLPSNRNIRYVFKRLNSIKSLTFDWISPPIYFNYAPSSPTSIPVLKNIGVAWTSSKDTLTRLVLAFRPRYPGIGLSLCNFPNLTEFNFELDVHPLDPSRPPPIVDMMSFDDVKLELAVFLSTHKERLKVFGLSFPSCPVVSDILDGLHTFPYLTGISFSFFLHSPLPVAAITRFIGRHSSTITSFGFQLVDTLLWSANTLSGWVSQIFRIDLPKLEYLSIFLLPGDFPSPALDSIFNSINSYALGAKVSTRHDVTPILSSDRLALQLKTLSLGIELHNRHLENLAVAIAKNGFFHLENLHVQSTTLYPDLLCLIAKLFPSLKRLCIKHWSVWITNELQPVYAPYPIHQPTWEEFARLSLTDWDLDELYLVRQYGWHADCDNKPEVFRNAMLRGLPRVKCFNGLSRDDHEWVTTRVELSDTPWFFESYPNRRVV
ncbi:hypothetical protein NP233_g10260 [Leucocoprinus birnbaumii]|uniref:Uncharacterized protein n=1 Tax=Leucocoprinus birnbaumii TaxID=56174 RepID=A0AAD5VPL6_9AGAR|nr:hypothetical protein NP233_g10260 [Leucocoprinus birnbaumii]